jgi:hypothetical protein
VYSVTLKNNNNAATKWKLGCAGNKIKKKI